ncbi:MAG: ATP-binding protein [Bryobacteraceae bacterium]|nr:ATP-binding protein [Bryobacteraceae bacterium]
MGYRSVALELILSFAATGLHLLLLPLVLRKRPREAADLFLAAALALAALYHGSMAVVRYQWVAFAAESVTGHSPISALALPFSLGFLLHYLLMQRGFSFLWGLLVYPLLALPYFPVAVVPAAMLSWTLGGHYRWFAVALALAGASALAPAAWLTELGASLPAACALYFVHRANAFGLVLERRLAFVFSMSVLSTVYLFLVRFVVGEYVVLEFGAFGALIEFTLICFAGILWLPLYEGITRFLSRRAQNYLDAAKRIIDAADTLLDTPGRVRFFAEHLGREFDFRRVALLLAGEPPLEARYGEHSELPPLEPLLKLARDLDAQVLHERRTRHAEVRALLHKTPFNYAFPLWFKDDPIGVLLIDTAPLLYLDEKEPILTNLAREISHSLETCTLIEQKIGLEKTLFQKEHLAALGKVAATIAHEVKNPLSSIRALAQLMGEDRAVADVYSQDLRFIISETDRLASSVQQLLAFSRPAAQPKPQVPLYDLLDATASAIAREQQPSGIVIRKDIDERLRQVPVDRHTLQQIVWNLLLNAVQASPAGAAVSLTAQLPDPRHCVFEVTDQGPGIPAGLREQIFDPFFTTRKQGTGLGLAIVKKNLAALGGAIDLVSPVESGRGARFRVSLPVEVSA